MRIEINDNMCLLLVVALIVALLTVLVLTIGFVQMKETDYFTSRGYTKQTLPGAESPVWTLVVRGAKP